MGRHLRKDRTIIYLGSAVTIIIMILLSIIIPTEDLEIGRGEVYSLNEKWEVNYGGNKIEDVTLPFKVHIPEGEEMLASIEIPANFPDDFKMRIRSSMQEIYVFLDGEEIFKTDKPKCDLFGIPEASVWYIIDLPSNIQGKTLSLKISSNVKSFSGKINPIFVGQGIDLLYKIVYDQRMGLFISVCIFIFGLFSLAFFFITKSTSDDRMLYLGIFAILFSIWIFSEARLIQLFTGNRFIIGGVSYIILSLIFIPFTLYLREAVLIGSKKILNGIALFSFLGFLTNITLQLFKISDFIHSIAYIFPIQIIVTVYLIYLLFNEAIKLKNQEAKKFLQYFGILLFFLMIELCVFYLGLYDYTSVSARIGIFVFLVFIIINSIRELERIIIREKETEFITKMAYQDILTGANNRAAFERDLDNLLSNEDNPNFRVIMMDINNLKYVNDNFGHQEGDNMIKLSYNTIKEVFNLNSKHYRIGGDEFISILDSSDEDIFTNQLNEFRSRLSEISKDLKYNLDIAIGSDIYPNKDFKEKVDFINNIDHLMYENKKLLKG